MTEGLVSSITPVYNSEKYIEATLLSILSQSYQNIEIIVVDDCSTDNTAAIINKMADKYRQIKYYRLEQNSGAAVARNKGIELAQGQFIAFIDSDDIWKPEKLERQISVVKNQKAEFVFTAIEIIDSDGKTIKSKRPVREEIGYKFLLKNTMIATSSVLIDVSKTGKFRMPFIRSGQDYATWLLLLRNGRTAYGVNEALVQYRRTKGSLSSDKVRNWKKVWKIQTEFEKINPVVAYFNCLAYIIHAIKKYFL